MLIGELFGSTSKAFGILLPLDGARLAVLLIQVLILIILLKKIVPKETE